jgi:hypothetical protein
VADLRCHDTALGIGIDRDAHDRGSWARPDPVRPTMRRGQGRTVLYTVARRVSVDVREEAPATGSLTVFAHLNAANPSLSRGEASVVAVLSIPLE